MNENTMQQLHEVSQTYPMECQKLRLLSGIDPPPEKLAYIIESIPGPTYIFQSVQNRTLSRSTTYSEVDSELDHVPTMSPDNASVAIDNNNPAAFTVAPTRPAAVPASNSWAAIAKQATPPPAPVRSGSISVSLSTDSRPASRATGGISDLSKFSKVLDLTNKANSVPRPKNSKKKDEDKSKQQHPSIDILKECDEDENGIYWSPQGTRIDPCPKWYNKEEVERVKKLKLCNIYHLRPPCHSDKKCVHNHTYKPTQSELDTLALVARMSPCQNGPHCEDNPCIYGHNCPAPKQASLSKLKGGQKAIEEGKLCIFGVECFFNGAMHYYVE
jgi:hypothetical protein